MLSKHLLSKQDAICLLELINENLSCKNTIAATMSKLQCLIPYDFAVCGEFVQDAGGRVKSFEIFNISYPSEWIDLYIRKEYHKVDPIFRLALSEHGVQYWGDTYRQNPPPRGFLSAAESFGLGKGYTCGLKDNQLNAGSFLSIAGASVKRKKRTELILDIVAPQLDQAIHRTFNHTKKSLPCLSQRERDVLNWTGHGKSSWDISVILGISERTVNFHVHNVMQKLGAVRRSQAVAIALHQGLIHID